ncbi:MAG TPA: DUF1566 domain-containing protein [Pseudoxanthomonas sp.]|nr:DUF1566 domain-containing protein [Pseudoxanthomonas sp.]
MNAALQTNEQTTRFVDNGDGTVTDTRTGLMWSQNTLSTKCVDHATAVKTCAELDLAGHTDWRLATVEELFLLADRTKYRPAIDTGAFPDTKSDWYWTSTIHASGSSYAWIVNFSDGYAYDFRRDGSSAFVRAVRSVPAGQ